jgi:hypothetical protein
VKVVSLTAENVKRLRAVEITPDPDGSIVVVAGRNAQGKSSILDSIWLALGGPAAGKATAKPVRDGESKATVTVDLGEIRVTRSWTADGKSKLSVNAADGAKYSSPQGLLDQLVGRLSFDPLAFAQQDEKSQRRQLLELVDLPFDPDDLAEQRAGIFAARTDVNRDLKTARAQLDGMPVPPADLPEEEVSAGDLLTQARTAEEQHREVVRVRDAAVNAAARVQEAKAELTAALQAQRAADAAVVDLPADLPDPDAVTAQLASMEETNAAVRAAKQRAEVADRVEQLDAYSQNLTDQISAIDRQRDEALAAATMPIDGLGIDEDGVTYQGVPLKQASGAEQLRVSLAMAMALNPRIRVIRITDGSLLDSSNMALIEQMATDADFQVWVERVDESGQVGVLIEDGAVVQALTPAAVPA